MRMTEEEDKLTHTVVSCCFLFETNYDEQILKNRLCPTSIILVNIAIKLIKQFQRISFTITENTLRLTVNSLSKILKM
jgi:hypothetical protein